MSQVRRTHAKTLMHTITHSGWTIHHNSGFDGDVIVVYPEGIKGRQHTPRDVGMEVPFEVLKHLVAMYAYGERERALTDALEAMSDDELLGMPKR